MVSEIERAKAALTWLDAGCDRETWVRIGMAAKSAGLSIDDWHEWSAKGGNYVGEADCRAAWKSFKNDGAVGPGTLFHEAKANGWRDDDTFQRPTPEALEARRREAAQSEAAEESRIVRKHAEAAAKAATIWKVATPAKIDHPYLLRKGVLPVATLREIEADAAAVILGYAPKSGGDQLAGRLLVAPVKVGVALSTLELIDGGGRKSAIAGGRKAGGYWAAQPLPEGDGEGMTFQYGEGVATTLSAKAANGNVSIAALSAGNLPSVAKAMLQRYPAAVHVILADLVKATGEPDSHAIDAALDVGRLLAIPNFGSDRPAGATDFNDMAQLCGQEAVRLCIESALNSPLRSPNTRRGDAMINPHRTIDADDSPVASPPDVPDHATDAMPHTSSHEIAPFLTPSLPQCDARDGTQNTRPLTELGNALRLFDANGNSLKHVHDARAWIIWNGAAWQWDTDGSGVRSLAAKLPDAIYSEGRLHLADAEHFAKWSRKSQQQRTINAAVSLLSDDPSVRLPLSDIDADHFAIGLDHARQVIDLRKGTTRAATPADFITKSLSPEAIGDATKAVRWMQFLEQVFQDDRELIDWLQRFAGYLLTGETREHLFLFCFGHGANGKSVFIETLKHIMGDYSRAIASETLSEGKRQAGSATPDLVDLIGARLVLCSETEDNTALAESLVKSLVAGDSMAVRGLYAAPVQFTPNFKLVMAGNHKPIVRGNDNGIWRRVRLVPFCRTFSPDERDPRLLDKLRAEAPHILAWMLAGCLAWQRDGMVDTPASIRDATADYQVDQDLIGRWLEECTSHSPQSETSSGELYANYQKWCQDNGQKPASNAVLGRRLSERGYTMRKSNSKRLVIGLTAIGSNPDGYTRAKYGD